MTLRLEVDGARWRGHLRAVHEATPGMVPVLKGNGYGFGLGRLARRAGWLGVDTVAVGTRTELGQVATRFDGDLLVMTPWRPFDADLDPALTRRVVHTVGRVGDLADLAARQPGARVVLEQLTSMRRHGLTAPELRAAVATLAELGDGLRLEGVALHLPLQRGSHLGEVRRLLNDVVGAGLATGGGRRLTLWVSHLTREELDAVRATWADLVVRPRVGTALWLGDRGALRVTGAVLDVHPVERGDAFGYRSRTVPKAGHLLVVSGGTAHGVGLEAPLGEASLRARAAVVARSGLDAAGFTRSPFSIDGKQRLFAEPPHMQSSMLFLPAGARVPEIGERVEVQVRYTATDVDEVCIG